MARQESENQKLLQEYKERNIRWTDRTLSQLSFYNNLLLTLGVGFLSFAYRDSKLLHLEFRLTNIDYPLTLYVFSLIALTLSIFIGFIASISRLYDFRITRQVNLIRQRVLEHSKKLIDEETPNKFSLWKNMSLPYALFFENYPTITLEQCKSWKDENKKDFVELRTLSYNLGVGSWYRIQLQTLLLILAILFYVLSTLLS